MTKGRCKKSAQPIDEDEIRQQAETLRARLEGGASAKAIAEARALLVMLRNMRAYEPLMALAEALCRIDPDDAPSRRLYAQALIETGAVVAAIGLLDPLLRALPSDHPEFGEAWGLLGRAHKQIFFDAAIKGSPGRRIALAQAIRAYSVPYRDDPKKHTWHGVNLLALQSRALREGWEDVTTDIKPAKLAAKLLKTLRALPESRHDEWTLPTLAEVSLGLALATGELGEVESTLLEYLAAPCVSAFQVASTLRQFTQVWGLDELSTRTPGIGLRGEMAVQRARNLVDILRARLMQLPGGMIELNAEQARQLAKPAPSRKRRTVPDQGQLEAVLGVDGPKTFAWWRAGVEASRSVAVIRQRLGKRLGTGFLLRAGDLGREAEPDELLLLTNFHVINPAGELRGIPPADAEVIFEAADPSKAYGVKELLWSSPANEHDASLLRLSGLPADLPPLMIERELPAPPHPEAKECPRVYVIGYPGGRELSISFQDNELLDHEGPPGGMPPNPEVWRVHYRAPTEGGSSGSPVFEDRQWRVIALHHMGGKLGMPRLNGVGGSYAANEGLALNTLAAAAARALNAEEGSAAG
ncbi:MAG: trypsin-like peptidase domain-containing protein [Hyphomicrobiaceae bacterium]|nr:trypsin-like peptidase domain-containing protein [Hyphomicrobiaceae bacterium]